MSCSRKEAHGKENEGREPSLSHTVIQKPNIFPSEGFHYPLDAQSPSLVAVNNFAEAAVITIPAAQESMC